MEVPDLEIDMNKKIIITLLTACLLQACTKNESAEKVTLSTAKTESVKTIAPDPKLIEQGKKSIEAQGMLELESALGRESPKANTYSVLMAEPVQFVRQEDNGVFVYTWNVRFQNNATQDVFGCDQSEVTWNKDGDEVVANLTDACFNVLVKGQQAEPTELTESQTDYQFSYRIESETVRYGNQSTILYTLVISSESDAPTELNKIKVNRGNCPIHIIPSQNNLLKFGQSFKVRLHCDAQDVKEVGLVVDKTHEITIKQ